MTVKNLEITIQCGGRGKRMGKLTDNQQKCILEVGGKPILGYLLEEISKAFGKAKVILLVSYKRESVSDYFGKQYKKLKLEYVEGSEEEARLALLAAEDHIQEDNFLSLAGDTIVERSELLNLVKVKEAELFGTILLSSRIEVAPTHGLAILEGRRVSKIIYPPKPSVIGPDTYVIIGPGFYSRRLFTRLKKHRTVANVTNVLVRSVKGGEIIEGEICTTPWFHFASPEDLKVKIEF